MTTNLIPFESSRGLANIVVRITEAPSREASEGGVDLRFRTHRSRAKLLSTYVSMVKSQRAVAALWSLTFVQVFFETFVLRCGFPKPCLEESLACLLHLQLLLEGAKLLSEFVLLCWRIRRRSSIVFACKLAKVLCFKAGMVNSVLVPCSFRFPFRFAALRRASRPPHLNAGVSDGIAPLRGLDHFSSGELRHRSVSILFQLSFVRFAQELFSAASPQC